MNHARNAVRFLIVILWLTVCGLLFSLLSNPNVRVFGWSTWLFYGAVVTAVLYAGFFATKKFWTFK